MAKSKSPAKKPVKKAATKKSTPSVPEAPKFASKSCRKAPKNTTGYVFKGVMDDGFEITAVGGSKEAAVEGAQAVLETIARYQSHLKAKEAARRKAYRAKAAKKSKK